MNRRVLVIGDVLLDSDVEGAVDRVCPDAPAPVVEIREVRERAGGAGLAATLLSRPGIDVTLATGFADDEPAKRLAALLDGTVEAVGIVDTHGTRCKTRVRSSGQSLVRLDTEPAAPAGAGEPACDAELLAELLAGADAVLVSDYAGGVASHRVVRALVEQQLGRVPVVWDPHPRSQPPPRGVMLATPNLDEATHFYGPGEGAAVAAGLRGRWGSTAVAVTAGGDGVFVATPTGTRFVPVPRRHHGDTCGAGDRFAGTAAAELAGGADAVAAVRTAVGDTADWLARGGVGATVAPSNLSGDPIRRIEEVRAAGGVVVATGGCFDVLHAGHIASLEAARELGDLLVVLLNSDDGVRRLKGSGRPVHRVEDRLRVLRSLRCVDEVVVFDEDDPSKVLRRLRPDVWAKGGDYEPASLPEAAVVAEWGGRVVGLPFVDGHSTTQILGHTRKDADGRTRALQPVQEGDRT